MPPQMTSTARNQGAKNALICGVGYLVFWVLTFAELPTDGIAATVVDKTGAVLWSDRLTAQDEPFKKGPPDPMVVCMLLVDRLCPQLGLNERTRSSCATAAARGSSRILQNSHHPDYQRIQPRSKEDCDKILVQRLKGYLK